MDPFKVLQVDKRPINGEGDVDLLRKKAKKLYKRFLSEKKKFEAKKVLDAFEMIRRQAKQSEFKILGRSRKERELDKHFNHQTKEIKKNKDLRRELRREARGGKKMHLRGDKEKIAAPRRKRRKRVAGPRVTREMHVLRGLGRLGPFLEQPQKFPKAMALLYRWVKEHMSSDNMEHVFQVLSEVADRRFIIEEPEARQEVVLVFEYVLSYFSQWFAEAEERQMMEKHWRIATLLSCRCFTDDAFILASTISHLTEVLEMMREKVPVLLTAEPEVKVPIKDEEKLDKASVKVLAVKDEEKEEEEAEEKACHGHQRGADRQRVKAEEQEDEKACCWDLEDESNFLIGNDSSMKTMANGRGLSRAFSHTSSVVSNLASIDLDADAKSEISSSLSMDAVEVDDGSSDSVDVLEEEISLSDVSSEASQDQDGDDDDQAEFVIFPVPSIKKSLAQMREKFVDRCLAALFQNRGPLWAQAKIDAFFQEVYYKRELFSDEQQSLVEAWQARIKVLQKSKERVLGEDNNPLEANRPVVDSREMRVNFDADSSAWAAKQTFDSRDRFGGSRTIR